QVELAGITGAWPVLFRPPFGELDARVVRVADSLGLRTITFDLASGDPGRKVTRASLVRWVLQQARPGSIVVMHINHLRFHTAEALPEIVAALRDRGFSFVTVSELMTPPPPPSAGPIQTSGGCLREPSGDPPWPRRHRRHGPSFRSQPYLRRQW